MLKARYFAILLVVFALTAAVVAAQEDTGDGTHEGGMMMMENTGLPQVGPEVTLRFMAMVNEQPAACGMIYEGVGAGESTLSLMDFRFYVSNVRLLTAAGIEIPVELTQDGLWQYANLALVDLEDGTSHCADAGTPEMHTVVTGTVPPGEYTGVLFDLGVPTDLNHLDAATAPAPLNLPAMWWTWRDGYKFVRVEMNTPDSATPAWLIHLGSTGCVGETPNTPPTEPCTHPNMVTVRLEDFNPVRNFIVADLGALVAGVDLNESIPMPPGCMSGLDDSDCARLFPGFGLDITTGMMDEARPQNFFRVQ